MALEKVAELDILQPGQMTQVKAGGKSTLLANVDGNYYAIHAICTHMGCNLSKGKLKGNVVTCPCHGSQFDVTTGNVVRGPAKKPEQAYKVIVQDSDILIEI